MDKQSADQSGNSTSGADNVSTETDGSIKKFVPYDDSNELQATDFAPFTAADLELQFPTKKPTDTQGPRGFGQSFYSQEQSDETEPQNSLLLKINAGCLSIFGILFVLLGVLYSGILLIIHLTASSSNFNNPFLKAVPNLGILPVVFQISAVLLFYAGLKISSASKKSFWVAFLIPMLTAGSVFILSQGLVTWLNKSLGTASDKLDSIKIVDLSFANQIQYVFLILLVLIPLISFGKFNRVDTALTSGRKTFLTVMTILLIGASASISGWIFYQQYLSDYNYAEMQSISEFHIYKPVSLPEGMDYAANFSNDQKLTNQKGAIIFGFMNSFEIPEPKVLNAVFVLENMVSKGFNFDDYIYNTYPNSDPAFVKTTITSLNAPAYWIPRQKTAISSGQDPTRGGILVLVTADNVLIKITSTGYTKDEILSFAGLLK